MQHLQRVPAAVCFGNGGLLAAFRGRALGGDGMCGCGLRGRLGLSCGRCGLPFRGPTEGTPYTEPFAGPAGPMAPTVGYPYYTTQLLATSCSTIRRRLVAKSDNSSNHRCGRDTESRSIKQTGRRVMGSPACLWNVAKLTSREIDESPACRAVGVDRRLAEWCDAR
ncbi:MAG: hypothetical protein R3B96_11845 [Pirellulaceae bacterium]